MSNRHSQEYTMQELVRLLDDANGHIFGELDENGFFESMPDDYMDKGIAGRIVENCILRCGTNIDQAPDIIVDGIKTEVKATGFQIKNMGYVAKEFVSVTAVSVNDIVNQEFYDSYFWHKISHILFIYYHYLKKPPCFSKDYKDFPIRGYEFYSFPDEDLQEIIREWTLVRDKVREMSKRENPRMHYPNIRQELGDELAMLGIAPKYPPRFRLKQGVMTNIIQRYFERTNLETLPNSMVKYADLDRKCREITAELKGMSIRQLYQYYGIEVYSFRNKAILSPLIIRMFGGNCNRYNQVEQFSKLGLRVKTIMMWKNHRMKELMKLFPVDFKELMSNDIFENSEIYQYFADHQFLFPIFEYTDTKEMLDCRFQGFKRLGFDDIFIDTHVRRLWEDTRSLIRDNRLVRTYKFNPDGTPAMNPRSNSQRSSLNFPCAREYMVFIKLGGIDSSHLTEEVNGIKMVTQWYWLNTKLMYDDLDKKDYL